MAPQKHPKSSILATIDPTISARPQFEVKIESNLASCKPCLKLDDPRKGHHKPSTRNKIPTPSHNVPKTMTAKAKNAPMSSASLIAIELKGLAALGEALKICIPAAFCPLWGPLLKICNPALKTLWPKALIHAQQCHTYNSTVHMLNMHSCN